MEQIMSEVSVPAPLPACRMEEIMKGFQEIMPGLHVGFFHGSVASRDALG
jgi:hypothetical protein